MILRRLLTLLGPPRHAVTTNHRTVRKVEQISLTDAEIRRVVELVDGEHFSGPQGLGERCYDILCCCYERAERVLTDIATDSSQAMERRANALYMLNDCDDDALLEASDDLSNNLQLLAVLLYGFPRFPRSHAPAWECS